MTGSRGEDFDVDALYAALDAERSARGMTWAEVMRSINAQLKGSPTGDAPCRRLRQFSSQLRLPRSRLSGRR